MKVERMILIAFFTNYLVNNVVAALASLVPPSPGAANPYFTAQYLTYVVLAAIVLGLMAWWYLQRLSRAGALMQGLTFGIVGFVVAVATALVSGMASVLVQTGSLSQLVAVLPNFFPSLMNMTTLILLGLWVVPALLVGWLMQSRMSAPSAAPAMPRPMI